MPRRHRTRQQRTAGLGRTLAALLLHTLLLPALLPMPAAAQAVSSNSLPDALRSQVLSLATQAASTAWGSATPAPRIEVVLGQLNARLKLAPCQRIEAYLPRNARALGPTRIGLRCLEGSVRWNVSLPVDVQLWARSLAATTTLPIGTVLESRHLVMQEVDLAERADPAIAQAEAAIGRTLARGLAAGDALRSGDLKTRTWFNAGDLVRIIGVGPGYSVSSEGRAMGPGLEGQRARVRTESGRIVSGIVSGERRIEVAL
jgi:flagella basal body P-ring formation protein FlgA